MSLPEDARSGRKSLPIYSMTGYASLRVDATDCISFTLTLKSVNHRFLDLQLRLPQNSEALEVVIRRALKEQIHRGHAEFSLQLDRQGPASASFDSEKIAGYIEVFRAIAQTHDLSSEPDLNEVLRLPGMMSSQQNSSRDGGAEIEAAVIAELPNLIASFNEVRAKEGEALGVELRGSMRRVEELGEEVSALREGARTATFERLRARIGELIEGMTINEDRILTEAALLADRSDIEEELVRLRTHAASFIELLDQGGPLGKRLDFLLQELNREANTLLSKTGGASSQNGLRITEIGLQIKVEIERAREQIQNIE
jgi:uncharacterized protein (TIGR00255 family)